MSTSKKKTKSSAPEFRVVRDILALANVSVPIALLRRRTTQEVLAAEHWAAVEHLRASGTEVRRMKKPDWLAT